MGAWWERVRLLVSGESAPSSPEHGRPAQRPVRTFVARRRVRVRGVVEVVRHRPTSGGAEAFVAQLDSDLGALELVWLGRRSLTGLEAGTRLTAYGVLTTVRGRKTIFNPDYALVPAEVTT